MQLHRLQRQFSQALKTNFLADPGFVKQLRPVGKLSLEEAIGIYHERYFAVLTEELSRSFPAVLWVLGLDKFKALCRKFIESQPSVSYNLFLYGAEFPEFISSHSISKNIPFLFDLAKLEWIIKKLAVAEPTTSLDQEEINEQTKASDYKVTFLDSFHLLSSPYSIFEIWCRREEPSYSFELIDWLKPEHLIVFKKEKQISMFQLQEIEADILRSLSNGVSMAESLSDFSTKMSPDKTIQFQKILKKSGIIKAIQIVRD